MFWVCRLGVSQLGFKLFVELRGFDGAHKDALGLATFAKEIPRLKEDGHWQSVGAAMALSQAQIAALSLDYTDLCGDRMSGAAALGTLLEARRLGTTRFSEIHQRLAQLREYEPPWDDLLDMA
eukprot:Skav229015  [mRNA]  locus=scaffold127:468487:475044:- [translate_table: standard]